MKLTWLGILVVLTLQSAALAQTTVRFTQRELDAGNVFLRPELNRLEIDGQSGVFTPAPSLRALGVEDNHFELDFTGLSQLAGIRFNHLRSRGPSTRFDGANLVITVPVEDQAQAGRSVFGSISLKNVVLTARLAWRARPDGQPELYVASTGYSGSITGTGAFRPGFMISLLQKLILRTLDQQATRLLNRPGVQDAIVTGLTGWARLSTGQEWREVVPGSVEFYTEGAESGLRYRVQ